jgi:short-subunit dehydrogenase
MMAYCAIVDPALANAMVVMSRHVPLTSRSQKNINGSHEKTERKNKMRVEMVMYDITR